MLKKCLFSLCLLISGLVLTAQTECDCEFDFNPVCVVDEASGDIVPIPNACIAECFGFSEADFVDCGEIDGEWPECDCDWEDIEPVCVTDDEGNVIPFPNACFAECEGFGTEDFVDCGEIDGEWPECDCDWEDIEPVCVTDDQGNVIPFPSACFAECEGFGAEDFVDCGEIDGEWPECDCDWEDIEPVCVTDDQGNIFPFPNACFAECEGFGAEDFVDCGEIDGEWPECDCDDSEFEPVCIIDENGDIIPFPNACFAECFGYSLDDTTDCGDLGGGGGYDCDCDFDVFEPVCVVDEFGDVIPFPNACFAECCGFTEEDFTECEEIDCGGGEYEDCECEFEFDPVCVMDENGDIFGFPNACLAECLGYSTEDFVDCGDSTGNECDCEFEFEPVCVEDADGNLIGFPNICFAECEGYTTEDLVDCGDGTGNECDCEFEFEPVCVEDADGNLIGFPNICFAECEGYTTEDLVDCGDGTGNECDCEFEFEPVCVEDADGNLIGFPNICFAECEGYTAEDLVDCGDGTGNECDCEFEFEPVCVEDADGNLIGFPNICFAECEGYTTEDLVDCGDGTGNECDCEFEFEPVCVEDETGEIFAFPNICFAECEGYTAEDLIDCEFIIEDDGEVARNSNSSYRLAGSSLSTPSSVTLSASPNPTTDMVNLTWTSRTEGTYDWQLFDLQGRVVEKGQGYAYGQKETMSIDLSNQIDGIYIVRLQTTEGEQTLKVTKL